MDESDRSNLLTLGNWVRVLRTMRGLTQEDLAQKAGIDAGMVGIIERGERSWGVTHIWPIAEAFEIPVQDLFPPPDGEATPRTHRSQGPRLRPARHRPGE